MRTFLASICLPPLLALASAAQADWTLDSDASRLSFISTKNASTAEVHYFRELAGSVGEDGSARVEVPLDSVETAIQIRNKRMREFLFETGKYPALIISATVNPEALGGAGRVTRDVELAVTLHGSTKTYTTPLALMSDGDGMLTVATLEPLVVEAADFDLEGGVGKLQELAGLASISTAVPVSAHLVFRED